jgi:hypothetical protein
MVWYWNKPAVSFGIIRVMIARDMSNNYYFIVKAKPYTSASVKQIIKDVFS